MSKISIINKSINANKLRQPHTSLFFNSCRRTIVCNNQCTTRYFDRTKHPDDHLNRFQSRSILTEADSGAKSDAFREKLGSKDPKFGHITEEEKENWPKFKDFSMANFKKTQKMNTGIIEYLEKQSDKTRTSFDRLFEKITGKRIDNAGNWVVTITLIIGGVMVVAYYKEAYVIFILSKYTLCIHDC